MSDRIEVGSSEWLDDVAVFLATVWYKDQTRNVYGEFYVWTRPAEEGERAAHPIVATDAPNDDWTKAGSRILPSFGVDEARRHIRVALKGAPILNPNVTADGRFQALYIRNPDRSDRYSPWILADHMRQP